MVDISPFRAYHYDFEGMGIAPERLLAPPYDVISEDMRAALASEPLNICNVMLGNKGDSYASAKKTLEGWIHDGNIVEDDAPCYYVYEQTFRIEGRLCQRNGITALLRLEPLGNNILPHEKTHSKTKEDRMALLSAIKANIEQIFMIYDDKEALLKELMERVKQPANELLAFTDPDGIRHRIFRIRRESDIGLVTSALAGRKVLIADGHHRYEVAQNYARCLDGRKGEGAHDFVICTLVNARDPGLITLPTHRLIHSLPQERIDALQSKLSEWFEIEAVGDRASMLARLEGREGCGVIGVWQIKEDRGFIAALKPELCSKDPVDRLDVSILHRYVIEKALDISTEMQERKENIDFVKGTEESFKVAESGGFQLLLILVPSSIPEIFEAAETGRLLPHKSTYFYPKLWSGLLMYLHGD